MPQSELTKKLKRNKGMTAFMRELRDKGFAKRGMRSKSGQVAKSLGLVQDVVRMPNGQLVTVFAAHAYYGPDWFKHTTPTDLEALTYEGNRALQDLDNAG